MQQGTAQGAVLLIIATAPVADLGGGQLRLDAKFLEGMAEHAAGWTGPLRCILREGGAIPFGKTVAQGDLGFDLVVLPPDAPLPDRVWQGVAVVAASADDAGALDLVAPAHRHGAKIVYALEYTLKTRLQILRLERGRTAPRKLWSALWHLRQERKRLRALRGADGVQFNGYPAFARYARLNQQAMLYLDGRMTCARMADAEDLAARHTRRLAGQPLRIIHSGRLEPMKGAQDLLPVMRALQRLGVRAELDIYGAGSLAAQIAAELPGFEGRVRLHEPVDFERELVPISRREADLFLSCHRQDDPSCSYLEAMGCGLAVVGYDNAMLAPLAAASGGGVCVPMGNVMALAQAIAALSQDAGRLQGMGAAALGFAQAHAFEHEFGLRMAHLRAFLPDR